MINCRAVIFSMEPLPSQSGARGTHSSLRGFSQHCKGQNSVHSTLANHFLRNVTEWWNFMICEKDCKVDPWENGNNCICWCSGSFFSRVKKKRLSLFTFLDFWIIKTHIFYSWKNLICFHSDAEDVGLVLNLLA